MRDDRLVVAFLKPFVEKHGRREDDCWDYLADALDFAGEPKMAAAIRATEDQTFIERTVSSARVLTRYALVRGWDKEAERFAAVVEKWDRRHGLPRPEKREWLN